MTFLAGAGAVAFWDAISSIMTFLVDLPSAVTSLIATYPLLALLGVPLVYLLIRWILKNWTYDLPSEWWDYTTPRSKW